MKKTIMLFAVFFIVGMASWSLFLYRGGETFLNLPSLLLVGGGVLLTCLVSFTPSEFFSVHNVLKKIYRDKERDMDEAMTFFTNVSQINKNKRTENVINLELEKMSSPFVKKVATLSFFEKDDKAIHSVLNSQIKNEKRTLDAAQRVLEKCAEVSPSWGMTGTIVGLMLTLDKMTDASAITANVSIALMTTLYGVLLSNGFFSPLASKVEQYRHKRMHTMNSVVETFTLFVHSPSPFLMKEKFEYEFGPKYKDLFYYLDTQHLKEKQLKEKMKTLYTSDRDNVAALLKKKQKKTQEEGYRNEL